MVKFNKYKDKNGLQKWEWKGSIGVDPLTNKQKVSSKRGFNTKSEAIIDFDRRRYELLNKMVNIDNSMDLEKLLEIYFEFKVHKVSENTIRRDINLIKSWYTKGIINPKIKLNKIKVIDCQIIFNSFTEEYKNPMTHYKIINAVFNFAVKQELILRNPFKNIDKDYIAKNNDHVGSYSKDELLKFVKEAKNEVNKQWFYLWSLIIRTGMRHGEARALKWSDIDLQNKIISITKTITTTRDNEEIIGTTTKNKSSIRMIGIDDYLLELLKEWREYQTDMILGLGYTLVSDDEQLLFTNQSNLHNGVIKSGSMRDSMVRICKRANIRYLSPHSLRHTYTSISLEAGSSLVDVSHSLGHSNTEITMKVYDSVTNQRREALAKNVGDYMGEF